MSTRGRGTKRSIDGSNFVFAPNVDLNAAPAASILAGGPPAMGAAGNVGDNSNNNDFAAAHPMNNVGDGSISVPVSAGSAGGTPKKNDRRHRCHMCGKLFNRPSSLKIHLTTHTGERPFPCPYPGCGRAFNVSSNMRRHFRTHNSGGAEGAAAPQTSTPGHAPQQQQQQQPQSQQQQTQTWNVNMYNPGISGPQQNPRAKGRRSKGQSGNDGEASEGPETDNGRQAGPQQIHPYPPFGAPGVYGGFPPPLMNIPGLPGIPDIPGIPDMHNIQGVPMGVQMMPIEMAFPVDPALTAQNAEADADADAEGDEDADEDADGENDGEGDGDGVAEGSNRPQLTHSTSNTRASTNATPTSKARGSTRIQAKGKTTGTPLSGAKGRGRPPKAANATQSSGQQQLQFRQILVPVSVPLTGDPAQATLIAQQYQQQYAQYAKYAQYAQYYMQHQQQAQAQAQAQAGQSSSHQGSQPQPPMPPPAQQSTLTDTAVQRPGPATSAERSTPGGAAQGNVGSAGASEVVGRSVFVHWGPKTESGTKEAKEKVDAQQNGSAMQALADSAASLSASEDAAKMNEAAGSAGKEQKKADGSSNTETATAAMYKPAGTAEGQATQEMSQEAQAKATDVPADASSPAADVDAMDVDEPADGDASSKPGSPSSPRKRRKVGRGRGRGRR